MRYHFKKSNIPVEKAEDQKVTSSNVMELNDQELASANGTYGGCGWGGGWGGGCGGWHRPRGWHHWHHRRWHHW